jgi:hypothetical protein
MARNKTPFAARGSTYNQAAMRKMPSSREWREPFIDRSLQAYQIRAARETCRPQAVTATRVVYFFATAPLSRAVLRDIFSSPARGRLRV